jgi:hypothetical protein
MTTAEKSGHLSTRTAFSFSKPLLSNLKWLTTYSEKYIINLETKTLAEKVETGLREKC